MKGKPVLYGTKIHLTPFDRLSMHIVAQMRNLEDGMEGSYQVWPCSETEQDLWYDTYLRDATQRRFIIHNDSAPVGWVALTHIDHKNQGAELGIRIIPQYQGKGYASEAIQILSEWAFAEANLRRLYSEVFAVNEPSRKLFEKAGWKEWGRKHQAHWQNGMWVDVICLEVFRDYVSPWWIKAPQYTSTASEVVPVDTDVELLGLRTEHIPLIIKGLEPIGDGIWVDPVTGLSAMGVQINPPQHQILDQVTE
jgi:RimJ/RimL family protein N-acetyltransferase